MIIPNPYSFGASSLPAFVQQSPAFGASSGPASSSPAFGASSGPASSYPTFGASSSPAFGASSSPAFSASSSPAFSASSSLVFGASSSPAFSASSTQTSPFFGASSTSVSDQKPAFGAFGLSPAQTSLFGSTSQPSQSAFGSNMFGTTSSPFGVSQPAFGAPSTPVFSSTQSPSFGSTGSASGTTSSNLFETEGALGWIPSTPAFGQSSSGFGAPAWGQSSPGFGFSSSAPAFGQSSSSGAQSTTATLGNTALGRSPSGGQQGGSIETPYTGTDEPDSNGLRKLQSISAMKAYKEKNREELRWEDYKLGDKGVPHVGNNSLAETDPSTTIIITEPSSSNGGSRQPGFGTHNSSTLGTITINSRPGTSITITPTSTTTITLTSTSGSTTVSIAPISGTTSTSTSGHTPFASPFVVPSQASQPSQTSTSIFNTIDSFDQIQPGNRGGFGSSLFEKSQNNSGPRSGSAAPATNPFNLLHWPRQLPFGHSAPSPSVQNGISGSLTATRDLKESVANQSDVALRITKELLLTEGKDKNMVYSPLSIHVVLSLIAAGSTKGHPLHDEMLKFLKSRSTELLNELALNLVPLVFADGTTSGGPSLSFAYGVWVEKSLPVKASFKEVLDNAYKAVLKQVDFRTKSEEARCEVNSWVEKVTRGLIKDLLPSGTVKCTTRIILANALYFKGAWDQTFEDSRTKMFDFHLLSGKSIKAPFMTSWKNQFVSVFYDFKVLKLPYKQGEDHNRRFSMYMFLPNASNGLPCLAQRVCSEAGFLDRYLPRRKVVVDKFLIPKFKITFGFEVSQVLETLGLKLPCLSETVVGDTPAVDMIIHKSFIEVNEEGTEAAAATAAVCASLSCGGPPVIQKIDFVADHPFLFLIQEESTGAVMFVGHVLNPIAE